MPAHDDIQPKRLMICTALRALMIYKACGLDKKEATFDRQKLLLFWHAKRDSNHYYPNSFSILLDILILNSSIADGKVC